MARFIITLLLLVTASAANYSFSRPEVELIRRPFEEFPQVIGAWSQVRQHWVDDATMAVLQVDDYFMRTYANKAGETIGLFIGYFKVQREGKQIHSPRQCLPGGGWTPLEVSTTRLSLSSSSSEKVPVNVYLMAKGDQKQLYLFWYQARGRIYANEYMNKLHLIFDAVTKNRTDGALVRINMAVTRTPEQTLSALLAFTSSIFPSLSEHIPD